MAIYYGDANGKAQEVLVVGKPGPQGPAGPQGAPGPQGPAGQGVPAGGTVRQVLTKASGMNYDTKWANMESWEEVTSFSNTYYKLMSNGNMRALIPKALYPIQASPTSTTITSGIRPINISNNIGDLPYSHYPAHDVCCGTGNMSDMSGTAMKKIFSIGVDLSSSTGRITINLVGLDFANSTMYTSVGLPSVVYMV